MRRVLAVCMGNICRSPTAEAVLTHGIRDRGQESRFEVASAGTHDFNVGRGADPRAAAAAAARGYDLGRHRARQVTADDLERFDHVLAMDLDNLRHLRALAPPRLHRKIELFLRYHPADDVAEVPDPYLGEAGFERVLDLIERASRGFLDHHAGGGEPG